MEIYYLKKYNQKELDCLDSLRNSKLAFSITCIISSMMIKKVSKKKKILDYQNKKKHFSVNPVG